MKHTSDSLSHSHAPAWECIPERSCVPSPTVACSRIPRRGSVAGGVPTLRRGNDKHTGNISPILSAGLLILSLLYCHVAGAEPSPPSFSLTEIAAGIYVHVGRHEQYTAANHGDIGNTAIIIGERCVAVLDSGGSPSVGERFRTVIKQLTPLPVCYVLNSHAHPDHVLGNRAFLSDKPIFIGHSGLAGALENNRSYYSEHFLQPIGEANVPDPIVLPTESVDTTRTLDLGKRRITLTAYAGKAHTSTDLSVFDEQTKTLWLADLLFMERIPALEGSIKGWLALIEKLRKVEAARVIPGHGPASAPWPAAVAAEERYFNTLVTEIRALLQSGTTLEQSLTRVGQGERDKWQLFGEYHQRNISRAYAELEWE